MGAVLTLSLTWCPSAGAHQGPVWLHVKLILVEPAQPGEAAKPCSRHVSPGLLIPPGVSRPGWRSAGHLFLQFIPYLICPQPVPLTPKGEVELDPTSPPLSQWKRDAEESYFHFRCHFFRVPDIARSCPPWSSYSFAQADRHCQNLLVSFT